MDVPKLSFRPDDDPQRIIDLNTAALEVLDGDPSTELELFGRLEERGFPVSDGLNNIPAILLARFSPMIATALQLAEIEPQDDTRETLHDLIRHMLSTPDVYTISRTPAVQASILKGVQAEFTLRSAAIEIEPVVTQEYGRVAGEIVVPPVVGNEPLLTAFREIPQAAQDIQHLVIITIGHIVLEGQMTFHQIMQMSR